MTYNGNMITVECVQCGKKATAHTHFMEERLNGWNIGFWDGKTVDTCPECLKKKEAEDE